MKVSSCIIRFGRPHTRTLAGGVLAALVVVGCRLALPWPIKSLVQGWVHGAQANQQMSWSSIAVLGGVFVAIAMTLGLADLIERLQFARFAISLVRDVRGAAFAAARRVDPSGSGTGEIVARLIGDTARIKTGIKGFLVHVAAHSVLLIGVTSVLLWLYLPMGLVFGGACVALGVVTWIGARVIYRRAARYRQKEGHLAEHIFESMIGGADADGFGDINNESSSVEASLTQMQGRATWAAHALFGLSVLSAVIVGIHGVSVGSIDPSVLIAIAMYAMMLRGPIVQIVRQGTRTGKIVASLERVGALIDDEERVDPSAQGTLNDALVIHNLRVRGRKGPGLKRRKALLIPSLNIPAGSRTAIVGAPASGKTLLLRLMAGYEHPSSGSIRVDGMPVLEVDCAILAGAEPSWPRRRLAEVIGVEPGSEQAERAFHLLDQLGGKMLTRTLHEGMDTRVSSAELSLAERRAVACVRAIMSTHPLVLFDDQTADLGSSARARRLRVILDSCSGRTVVATFRRQPPAGMFDRVLNLRKGRIAHDSAGASISDDPFERICEVQV